MLAKDANLALRFLAPIAVSLTRPATSLVQAVLVSNEGLLVILLPIVLLNRRKVNCLLVIWMIPHSIVLLAQSLVFGIMLLVWLYVLLLFL